MHSFKNFDFYHQTYCNIQYGKGYVLNKISGNEGAYEN